MNNEFFNAYVENILEDLNQMNRLRLMMKTQIDMLEKTVKAQAERIKELEVLDNAEALPPEEPKTEHNF